MRNCRPYLKAALDALPKLTTIIALGQVAHQSAVKACGEKLPKRRFAHGAVRTFSDGRTLIDSYHTSRYNQNTGRITEDMFDEVFARAGLMAQGPVAFVQKGLAMKTAILAAGLLSTAAFALPKDMPTDPKPAQANVPAIRLLPAEPAKPANAVASIGGRRSATPITSPRAQQLTARRFKTSAGSKRSAIAGAGTATIQKLIIAIATA